MTNEPQFQFELDFTYGEPTPLSPLVRRIVANNPSPFTLHGTGTYIVGTQTVAVIDPGPDTPQHIDALLEALEPETVSHILVTHTHCDHSPAARAIQAATGAPTYGFGPHGGGIQDAPVEEGADLDFDPDIKLADGDKVSGENWTLSAVHTPGHTSNHLCFSLEEERVLFSGDHVMGWSTTVVSPPDGDMGDYMKSLHKLTKRNDMLYWPTHGPSIESPQAFVTKLIAHRQERERQILECLGQNITTIERIVQSLYTHVPTYLHPAAEQSVLAHLIHMVERGVVRCDGDANAKSEYRPVS